MLRAKRAEVLANNMANADTPGFKARDFDFEAVLNRETGDIPQLRTTRPRHIRTDAGPVPQALLAYRVPNQPSLDGNTVDNQLEQVAFAENAMKYQASLRFLDGKIKGLLTAIKG